jgi:hypothetical protein
VTSFARRVKRIRVYTWLTRINTCSTYKFQIKLEKYIRKIRKNRVVPVTKNKIDMSYSEILYRLERFRSLTSVSSQYFKHASILKVWYAEVFYVCTHVRRACSCSACLDVSKLFICWLRTFNNMTRMTYEYVMCRYVQRRTLIYVRIYTHMYTFMSDTFIIILIPNDIISGELTDFWNFSLGDENNMLCH